MSPQIGDTRRTADLEAQRVYRRLLNDGPAAMFCLVGKASRELITRGGRLLIHDNADELRLLMAGVDVIPIPKSERGRPLDELLVLAAHEANTSLLWPLDPSDFRQDGDGNRRPDPDRLTVPTPST